MAASGDSFPHILTSKTHFFGLKLYVLVGMGVVVVVCVVAIFLAFLCFYSKPRSSKGRKAGARQVHGSGSIPAVTKTIVELKASADRVERGSGDEVDVVNAEAGLAKFRQVEIGGDEAGYGGGEKTRRASDVDASGRWRESAATAEERRNMGWGRWYGLKELEIATRGFAEENVIGEGGYGVVYGGVLSDGSAVAVKNLLNKK